MVARRLEFGAALLTLALGLAGLFGSLYRPSGLLEDRVERVVVVILVIATALVAAVAITAVVDSRDGGEWARRILWCASVLLLFGAAATIMTIGWLFLPAGILAVSAAFLSWRSGD